ESHHEQIVQTHTYEDRVRTVEKAKQAGLSPCSGLIVGMGESDRQIVEALFALRDMRADPIPSNFLIPFDGTPMAGRWDLTPAQGEAAAADLEMIRENGFVPVEPRTSTGREPAATCLQHAPVVRERGAGTSAPPNA